MDAFAGKPGAKGETRPEEKNGVCGVPECGELLDDDMGGVAGLSSAGIAGYQDRETELRGRESFEDVEPEANEETVRGAGEEMEDVERFGPHGVLGFYGICQRTGLPESPQ